MTNYAFGVDVGGTTVKMGLFTVAGEPVRMWEIKTRTEDHGKHILSDISESIDDALKKENISKINVSGIGLDVPGPVGSDGTVYKCVNLGWGVFNVEEELKALSGLHVKAGNDANVAALGEMWQGGGKGYKNLLMVTLGTGIGGGVIINGKIVPGAFGAAGEIGHMPIFDFEDEEDVCGCGKRGCLEQYTAVGGVARITRRYLQSHSEDSVLRQYETVTPKQFFDAAKADDCAALAILDDYGKYLGRALASAACVIDPEVFVIGGGMSNAGDIVIDAIKKHYMRYAFHASRNTQFALAKLGNKAGMYGGVKMVI